MTIEFTLFLLISSPNSSHIFPTLSPVHDLPLLVNSMIQVPLLSHQRVVYDLFPIVVHRLLSCIELLTFFFSWQLASHFLMLGVLLSVEGTFQVSSNSFLPIPEPEVCAVLSTMALLSLREVNCNTALSRKL
jgi:hypothetical protein